MLKDFIEKNRGRGYFLEHDIKGFLKEDGLPVPDGVFVENIGQLSLASHLIYPLAAKVSSSRISSKSDMNGVRLGLKDKEELEEAVAGLLQIQDAEGALIEEMAPKGIEVIVGGVIDKQFGPVMMFGLGGVFVELFGDVAFSLAPLKREDAIWLISQIRGYKLLEGCRGSRPIDRDALLSVIVRISEFMATGLIEEIDLNPIALYPDGVMILDAKMTAKPAA